MIASHPSIQGLKMHLKFTHAPSLSNRSEVGDITGRQGLPYSYRKANKIRQAISLGGKRNIGTGSVQMPSAIKRFLKVLP